MKSMNILFTSVGRRVELISLFKAAYESLTLTGLIVGLDIDPLAPALRVCDVSYMVPPFTSKDYVSAVIDACERHRVDLVFPLTDPDIGVLSSHRPAIEATGARVVAVSADAARITSDKWLTRSFFASLGLSTPESWLPEQFNPHLVHYPLFIKPRIGSSSQHAYQLNNAWEAQFFASYVSNPIIQELILGPEITTDVICGVDGRLLDVVLRKRIAVRSGEVMKGVTIRDDRIVDACCRIAAALPAIGPITVQCMIGVDGAPQFTEINARLGGGVPLAIAAGIDVPSLLLRNAMGIDVQKDAIGNYELGLYMSRFDDSFFVTERERDTVASHRL